MSFIEQWLHDAVPALVGGQWRKGQQTFAGDNPATGETFTKEADKVVKMTIAKALKDSVNADA